MSRDVVQTVITRAAEGGFLAESEEMAEIARSWAQYGSQRPPSWSDRLLHWLRGDRAAREPLL